VGAGFASSYYETLAGHTSADSLKLCTQPLISFHPRKNGIEWWKGWGVRENSGNGYLSGKLMQIAMNLLWRNVTFGGININCNYSLLEKLEYFTYTNKDKEMIDSD